MNIPRAQCAAASNVSFHFVCTSRLPSRTVPHAEFIIYTRGLSTARFKWPIANHHVTKAARAVTQTPSYTAQESVLRATFKRLLDNLASRGLAGGDLLEIGCGYGYLLDEARSLFDRRVGTEFSTQGAEIARKTAAEVFVGGIERLRSRCCGDCCKP